MGWARRMSTGAMVRGAAFDVVMLWGVLVEVLALALACPAPPVEVVLALADILYAGVLRAVVMVLFCGLVGLCCAAVQKCACV